MIKNNQELFFNHIKQLFIQNPTININSDVIYSELTVFNSKNKQNVRINRESLVGIQVKMANYYRDDNSVNTFSNGYFWVIENRGNYQDREFYHELGNCIKLYVAVDPLTIKNVSLMIFDFMTKENIINQSKISRDMRNDALVLRVRNKKDADKIIKFINEDIKYNSSIKPNPFICSIGNVSITLDGTLSYNSTLTKLMVAYFQEKQSIGSLDTSSLDDFSKYIKNQIEILNNNQNKYLLDSYDIENQEQLRDFIMIMDVLVKNLDGNITKEDIYQKQEERINGKVVNRDNPSDNDFNSILHIMNGLVNKYGIEIAHKRILLYINKKQDVNIFTRDNNIRNIVIRNFTPEKMKEIILSLGYEALINAINETIIKYDIEQAKYAIRKLIEEENIDSFTNDNDVRSYLGFIIPIELLKQLIVDKTLEKKVYPSKDNIIEILIEEAQNESKIRGRK